MKKFRIAAMIVVSILAISWAGRLVVILDDGFHYQLVTQCEITLFDENRDILFYGYTDHNGGVNIHNLEDGIYRGTLRAFGKTFFREIEIDNSRTVDTLFIYER